MRKEYITLFPNINDTDCPLDHLDTYYFYPLYSIIYNSFLYLQEKCQYMALLNN